MIIKTFKCDDCGTTGRIILSGVEFLKQDIQYCPVCMGEVYEISAELIDLPEIDDVNS